jgi:hypothetical protein
LGQTQDLAAPNELVAMVFDVGRIGFKRSRDQIDG